MAPARIQIDTHGLGTATAAIFLRVMWGMDKIEASALLYLAIVKAQTEGPTDHIDPRVAEAASDPTHQCPAIAIGVNRSKAPPTPPLAAVDPSRLVGAEPAPAEPEGETLVLKIRRGLNLVSVIGLLRIAEWQLMTAGPSAWIGGPPDGGIGVFTEADLKNVPSLAGLRGDRGPVKA